MKYFQRTRSISYHYNDVIMGAIASEIASLTIVYSTVYSDADQRKHQSSASLVFVQGIHRGPVNSQHKWPVTRKMFPFDDVITIIRMSLLHFIIISDYVTYWILSSVRNNCNNLWHLGPTILEHANIYWFFFRKYSSCQGFYISWPLIMVLLQITGRGPRSCDRTFAVRNRRVQHWFVAIFCDILSGLYVLCRLIS